MVACAYNPSAGEMETSGLWDSLASQPNLGEVQVSERYFLKVDNALEDGYPRLVFGLAPIRYCNTKIKHKVLQ